VEHFGRGVGPVQTYCDSPDRENKLDSFFSKLLWYCRLLGINTGVITVSMGSSREQIYLYFQNTPLFLSHLDSSNIALSLFAILLDPLQLC
jgi:hypothetical protein